MDGIFLRNFFALQSPRLLIWNIKSHRRVRTYLRDKILSYEAISMRYFNKYKIVTFVLAKLMEMEATEQNQVAMYLFNNVI